MRESCIICDYAELLHRKSRPVLPAQDGSKMNIQPVGNSDRLQNPIIVKKPALTTNKE